MAISLYLNLNLSENTEFLWMDFGIRHMFKDDDSFHEELHKMVNNITSNDKVRISSCIDPNLKHSNDIYKVVAWYFAGSVFGGQSHALLDFANLTRAKCETILTSKKHLMWEVNVWYLIYQSKPELFDPYKCSHNPSIISNYVKN